MDQLYYDNFADEVVTSVDEIAPPERYIRVHCGDNVFIEKWNVGNYTFLEIAYSQTDIELGMVNSIRRRVAEDNDAKLQYMTDWTVTADHYKKMRGAVNDM